MTNHDALKAVIAEMDERSYDPIRRWREKLVAIAAEMERERATTLLEVQLVAYALLGFEPDQKFISQDDAKDCAAGVIELVHESASVPVKSNG